MSLDFDKFSFVSIDMVRKYNKSTGVLDWILDELQDATLSSGEEVVYGTGKLGGRITALKKNKTASFTCNNGFVVGGLLADQWGTAPEVATTATIKNSYLEYITVGSETTVTTKFAATGTEGAEIGWIYTANSDSSKNMAYAQGATASATAFSYVPSTKTLTLPTDVYDEGDIIIVSYDYLTKGKKYVNSGNTTSGSGKVVLDLTVKDGCNENEYHAVVIGDNASINGQFDLAFGGDQSVHALSIDFLKANCSTNKEFFAFIIPEAS